MIYSDYHGTIIWSFNILVLTPRGLVQSNVVKMIVDDVSFT